MRPHLLRSNTLYRLGVQQAESTRLFSNPHPKAELNALYPDLTFEYHLRSHNPHDTWSVTYSMQDISNNGFHSCNCGHRVCRPALFSAVLELPYVLSASLYYRTQSILENHAILIYILTCAPATWSRQVRAGARLTALRNCSNSMRPK